MISASEKYLRLFPELGFPFLVYDFFCFHFDHFVLELFGADSWHENGKPVT